MTTIQISDELGKRLSEVAKHNNLSKELYVEKMLAQLVEDEEDIERAAARLAENNGTVPWSEAKKQLGLGNENLES
jgi:predicted transcriptional regulator